MGKSWLLRRFAQECEERKLPNALIDFGDGLAYDALLLARRLRDEFRAVEFNPLTAAINEATTSQLQINTGTPAASTGISLGSQNTVGDVEISVGGDVAGGNIIKDNYFVIQTDNALIRQAFEDRVTAVFGECLQALTRRAQTVMMFDTYERASTEQERWEPNVADRWIGRNLLEPIRDGLLQNAVVVLAGRRVPPFGAEWNEVLGRMDLPAFERVDVATYLRQNRGLATLSDEQINALYNAVQGNPTLLGVIGDNLENAAGGVKDEEW
jgi:hypothetical protein